MDEYRLLHLLEKKVGPLSVRGWIIAGSAAYWAVSLLGGISAPMREADRVAQRVSSWRGVASELAEALTEPLADRLADRLAGALMRRGISVTMAPPGGEPRG